jgi:hypothetical protein
VLWLKIWHVRLTCQADQPCNLAGWPSFLLAPPLGIGYPEHRLYWTCRQNIFSKCATHGRPTKVIWLVGNTLARLSPCFVPHHFLVSYCLWLCLIFDIMKIWMDFCPYRVVPSSDVPEMLEQQNSWNSVIISTYILYLEWNVGMLVVNICILWPQTAVSSVTRNRATRGTGWPSRAVKSENGPLRGGSIPIVESHQFPNSIQTSKLKQEAFPCPKNIQIFHRTRFNYFDHLSRLGRLQILNAIHGINSGTEFNLNLLWILKGFKSCRKNQVNSLKFYLNLIFTKVNLVWHTSMKKLVF